MEFTNMGLIALINGFDMIGTNKYLLGDSELLKIYQGFSPGWYKDIG